MTALDVLACFFSLTKINIKIYIITQLWLMEMEKYNA